MHGKHGVAGSNPAPGFSRDPAARFRRGLDFSLTDEQQDFVAAIRDFCRRECGTPEQRELRELDFRQLKYG